MEMLWDGLKIAAVIVAAGLIVYGCMRALKASGRNARGGSPEHGRPRQSTPTAIGAVSPPPSVPAQTLPVREYVPGPVLTRRDDALYAVISGAIAEALAAEGVNPEGGFEITAIRTVNDPAAPKLTVKDGTLHAVIAAVISEVLSAEGINPEGGFTIQAVKPL